jgi:hypothetical protein
MGADGYINAAGDDDGQQAMDDRQQAENEGGWQVATAGSTTVGDAMAGGDGRQSLPPLRPLTCLFPLLL